MKVGNGSFNDTNEIAINLATSLVRVAKGAGLNCEAILTDMNQVLGWNAGHALEIVESIEYLTNNKKNKIRMIYVRVNFIWEFNIAEIKSWRIQQL